MTPKITESGIAMMVRALKGEGLTFTKVALGNGEKPSNYMKLNDLVNPIVEIGLDEITMQDSYVLLRAVLKNTEITAGFEWTEIGVYGKNTDSEEEELYAYRHYQIVDDESEEVGVTYIPKFGSDLVDISLSIYVYVGEIKNVTAALAESATYATKAELSSHADDEGNPHNVTAAQVGLGLVPNVPTNDQTPTYTAPQILSGLVSGEKLSVAFGKLKLGLDNFIAHLKDATAHVTTAERNKWNGKAEGTHYHAATQINSGVLGIARGGTGGGSAEEAMHALGGIYAGTVSSTYKIPNSANLNSYIAGGTYWCTSGDVAKTLKNCPYPNSNFVFLVFAPVSTQVFQMILPNRSNDNITIYFRAFNNTWGPWRKVTTSST